MTVGATGLLAQAARRPVNLLLILPTDQPRDTTMATTTFPPDPCPATYEANVAMLDKEPRDILLQNRTPWYIMARLAREGFTTLKQAPTVNHKPKSTTAPQLSAAAPRC